MSRRTNPVQQINKKALRVEVLCDFDGTITNEDIGFKIIEAFARPGWQEIEEAYQRGEKGSREALMEIFALMRVTEERLSRFIDEHFYVDPSFGEFVKYCHRSKVNVTVLSDGFDFYIQHVFRKFNINLPFLANTLRVVDCTIQAGFPYTDQGCGACGNCKMSYAKKRKALGARLVYIGDGYSDRCVSEAADVLFAKNVLAQHCEKHGISYLPFRNFSDILSACRQGGFEGLINQEEKDEDSR